MLRFIIINNLVNVDKKTCKSGTSQCKLSKTKKESLNLLGPKITLLGYFRARILKT